MAGHQMAGTEVERGIGATGELRFSISNHDKGNVPMRVVEGFCLTSLLFKQSYARGEVPV